MLHWFLPWLVPVLQMHTAMSAIYLGVRDPNSVLVLVQQAFTDQVISPASTFPSKEAYLNKDYGNIIHLLLQPRSSLRDPLVSVS